MRILIWTDDFWPDLGGLEVFCMRLATALRDRGHVCAIMANRSDPVPPGPHFYQGIPVHGFQFNAAVNDGNLAGIGSLLRGCSEVIERFKPDVIHLNAVRKSILCFILQQRRRRLPTVMTLHNHSLLLKASGTGAVVFQNADLLVAISRFIAGEALAYDPGLQDKLRTVLNALPSPSITPAPPPPEPRLLAFGRLSREKGFDLALEAFARIAPLFPEATLTLAGDGPERTALETLAEKLGLTPRVHFPGWISPDEIPELISRHSLVVVPSRWKEPFGLVALQAAQAGRPVVASHAGGLAEIVVDSQTGKLFENKNVAALAEAIRFFLEQPAEGIRMGQQALAHARDHFDFERFISAYEELYREAQTLRA